jgi:uncharacterized membrane protein
VGPTALGAMVVGVLGIGLGAAVGYTLLAPHLPPETWKGLGAISASWTGGSANMLAVKEALQMPDAAFPPFVIVDTLVTYTWMGLMIALAPWQGRWDSWVKADRSRLEEAGRRLAEAAGTHQESAGPARPIRMLGMLAGGLALGAMCLRAAELLPYKGSVLSTSAWAFILVSLLGIALSFTPVARLERYGASRVGYFCLYLLLAAIGARAHLQDIFKAPLLLAMAAVLVAVHAGLLAVYGRLRRVPLFFLVTASQANIGGTASAPIVAGIYQPRLASLGLLLAVGANVVGTYIGLTIAHLCRLIHP